MINFLKIFISFLPLFALSLGLDSCGSSRGSDNIMLEQNPPFTLDEANFQKWAAGIKEGGSGIEIQIVFGKMNSDVTIKNIYFRNQILELRRSIAGSPTFLANYSTSSQNEVIMDIDPMKEAQNTPSQGFPFQLKENEAVVSYLYKGDLKYFKISKLTEKEKVSYPQSNPNLGD